METLIVHPTDDTVKALKAFLKALKIRFEESPYNAEFVEKIKKGDEDYKAGNFKKIKKEDLWK